MLTKEEFKELNEKYPNVKMEGCEVCVFENKQRLMFKEKIQQIEWIAGPFLLIKGRELWNICSENLVWISDNKASHYVQPIYRGKEVIGFCIDKDQIINRVGEHVIGRLSGIEYAYVNELDTVLLKLPNGNSIPFYGTERQRESFEKKELLSKGVKLGTYKILKSPDRKNDMIWAQDGNLYNRFLSRVGYVHPNYKVEQIINTGAIEQTLTGKTSENYHHRVATDSKAHITYEVITGYAPGGVTVKMYERNGKEIGEIHNTLMVPILS